MRVACRNCGTIGESVKPLKGSGWITFILLCFYIIPGIIYMIWRRTGTKECCAKCKSENIVPAGAPAASAAIYSVATPETHVKCPECRELVLKDARKCKHCGAALIPCTEAGTTDDAKNRAEDAKFWSP